VECYTLRARHNGRLFPLSTHPTCTLHDLPSRLQVQALIISNRKLNLVFRFLVWHSHLRLL